MSLKQLLSAGNWVFCNKTLCKQIGLEASAIVGLLCSQQELSNGWFVYTYEKVEQELGIKLHSARKAFQCLIDSEIIETRRAGNPCKTYYRVNEFKLGGLFSFTAENTPLVPPKTQPLVPPKTQPLVPPKTQPLVPPKTQPLVPPKTQPLLLNRNILRNNFKNTYAQTGFARVWEAYPRKVSKKQAEITFQKLYEKNTLPILEVILESIEKHKHLPQWKTPRHIPHLSTFLNGEMWNDELTEKDFQNTSNSNKSGSQNYTTQFQEYRQPTKL